MRDLYRDTLAIADPATGALKPLEGVQVYVYSPGTTSTVTIYQGRTGAAQVANPFITGADGAVEFYAEEGSYDVHYVDTDVPARFGATTRLWNAVDPVVEQGNLDPTLLPYFIPVGAILPYGGATAPSGWKLCDGAAINRTDFAALFAVLGTSYGAGNGTSTFNLPDLRGRAPFGADSGAGRLTAATHPNQRGQSGGVETHALTSQESGMHNHYHSGNCPSHVHSGACPDHLHYVSIGGGTGGEFQGALGRQSGGGTCAPSGHTHGVSVAGYSGAADRSLAFSTGGPSATAFNTAGPSGAAGASAHRNVPPYQIFNYIIKY
jgi:microcystin-dependent protein